MIGDAAVYDAFITGVARIIFIGASRHAPYKRDHCRPKNDKREGNTKHKAGEKGARCDQNQPTLLQYLAGKPPEGRHHNRQDGRLDAKEYGRHRHRLLIADIKNAECQDNDCAGQDEQHAGNNTASHGAAASQDRW